MARKKLRMPRVLKRKRKTLSEPWRECFSLGTGLVFLSILAFTKIELYTSGVLIFIVGVYFLLRGSQIKQNKKASFENWMRYKVLQSVILIGIGLVLMSSFPLRFFGISILLTIFGFLHFIALKIHFFERK